MILRATLILAALAWGTTASAQSFPDRTNLRVNDLADLIPAEEEIHLTRQLDAAHADLGSDITILTIPSRSDYGTSPSIEAFATDLFNAWGIGTQEQNYGVLILVIRDDREMRVELGADYPPVYDTITENVIDNSFLPYFREGDYLTGIERGTAQVIDRIAGPFARGEEVRAPEPQNPFRHLWLYVLGGLGIAGAGGRWIYRRRKTCPQCGELTLNRKKTTLTSATRYSRGEGQLDLDCPNCGFSKTSTYVIPMISTSSSSSSGSSGSSSSGGSSSGGGGSGSW